MTVAFVSFDGIGLDRAMRILGIEGGGTKTTWVLVTPEGEVLQQGEAGSGNTLLLDDAALARLLGSIRENSGTDVDAIGGAFAGCYQAVEQARVEEALRAAWPQAKNVRAVEDTRSGLAAAFGAGPGILVIAGTGSNVAGQKTAESPVEKAGGWGHLFADRGSAYDVARRGLEKIFLRFDESGKTGDLAAKYLAATGTATMEELVAFALRDTSKTTVASWARCVFDAAEKGDRDARAVLDEAAASLAEKVAIIARRLRFSAPQVAMTGGLFEKQADYQKRFQKTLKQTLPQAHTFLLTVPGAQGAARLAGLKTAVATKIAEDKIPALPSDPARLKAYAQAATEQRNPRSRGLDRRSIPQLVDLFIREERHVENALRAQRKNISQAATIVAKKLASGGRLIYVGAGTSGRLGVVDASEMPPTFNAPPEQVQALIAGGPAAVFRSQEGAEDSRENGAAELRALGLTKKDAVCGIAASGQTPYVLGALEYARKIGVATILLSCNPRRVMRVPVDVAIDLATGPELVTGSTRLKAGTATKLVLNMLSTIAMVRLGRVQDNWMVNVQATNDKLRARAVRLVQALSRADESTARTALEGNEWSVSVAAKKLKTVRKARR